MKLLEKVLWNDVKNEVKALNLSLYNIIESISPGLEYPLYKIKYPFGMDIAANGKLSIPDPFIQKYEFLNPHEHASFYEDLSYAPTPLCLQLKKKSEVYFNFNSKTVPLDIFHPGQLFGLFEVVSQFAKVKIFPTWHVSSGVKSTFSLCNISNAAFHNKIQKKLKLDLHFPHTLSEHWKTFYDISQAIPIGDWHSEVLVFSRNWLNPLMETKAWLEFKQYLLIKSWQQSNYRRNRIEMVSTWEKILQTNASLPVSLIDIVKHLLTMAFGDIPGFVPTLEETEALPGAYIEKIYQDYYGLKTPLTIMVPQLIDYQNADRPIYFSLSHPTSLNDYFLYENPRNIWSDIESISKYISAILPHFNQAAENINLKNENFKFYHAKGDNQSVLPLSKIIKNDPILKKIFLNEANIPIGSKFLTGCVGIHPG